MDSINKTDMALLDKEVSNEAESELGPLKYLAETTGQPMNKVVNWFLLLIIFVFDPLAIALVIAANMAFNQIRKPEDPTEDYFKKRNEHLNKVVMSVPEGKEFNRPYTIPKSMTHPKKSKKIGLDVLVDILEEEEKESQQRMNVIGQNGNDGLHYDQEEMIKKNEEILATPKEDIYQEKEETAEDRKNRLEDEYARKKNWGTKG